MPTKILLTILLFICLQTRASKIDTIEAPNYCDSARVYSIKAAVYEEGMNMFKIGPMHTYYARWHHDLYVKEEYFKHKCSTQER